MTGHHDDIHHAQLGLRGSLTQSAEHPTQRHYLFANSRGWICESASSLQLDATATPFVPASLRKKQHYDALRGNYHWTTDVAADNTAAAGPDEALVPDRCMTANDMERTRLRFSEAALAERETIQQRTIQQAIQQRTIQQKAIQQKAIQQEAIQQRTIQEKAIQQRTIQQAIQQRTIQQEAIQLEAFLAQQQAILAQLKAIHQEANQQMAIQEKAIQQMAVQEKAIQQAIQEKAIQQMAVQQMAIPALQEAVVAEHKAIPEPSKDNSERVAKSPSGTEKCPSSFQPMGAPPVQVQSSAPLTSYLEFERTPSEPVWPSGKAL